MPLLRRCAWMPVFEERSGMRPRDARALAFCAVTILGLAAISFAVSQSYLIALGLTGGLVAGLEGLAHFLGEGVDVRSKVVAPGRRLQWYPSVRLRSRDGRASVGIRPARRPHRGPSPR